VALTVIRVEVIVIALLAIYFIIEHARTKWWRTPAGRQLMIMALIALVEHVMIALVVTRVHISHWIFVALFTISGLAWTGWVYLLVRVRHRGPPPEDQL
jgi:cytochrome bd-type quinol oxidase subunit 1